MTDFADNSPFFPVIGAAVIVGATLFLCRYGGRAVVEEELESQWSEDELDGWERVEQESGNEAYRRVETDDYGQEEF